MGGGQYDPRISRQTGINEYYDQAPRANSPPFTGYGEMLNGAIQAQTWLPAIVSNDEPRQHGRAEPTHHHMSDGMEELDDADIDLVASGSSPEAIVEPLPSLERSRSRVASGPLSERNLRSPSSDQNEVKKAKTCVRCRMQKMKVSRIFFFLLYIQVNWFVF